MMTAKRAMGWVVGGIVGLFVLYMGVLIVKNIVHLSRGGGATTKTEESFDATIARTFRSASSTRLSDKDLADITNGDHPYVGRRRAPIQIVEFVDFHCPYCKRVAPVIRDLMKTRTDVFWVIRDWPVADLHPLAEKANVAAQCVWRDSPNAYWRMYDLLFAGDPVSDDDALRELARQAGADLAKYDVCIRTDAALPEIQSSLDLVSRLDLGGTPTFFVNGVRITGAPDASQWRVILDQARGSSLANPSKQ